MNLNSDWDKFERMSIFELLDLCDDLKDLQKEMKQK